VWLGSQLSVVPLKPELRGQLYDVEPLGVGIPGLASRQSKPSWVPLPVQLAPQDLSFSPVTLTHLPLLHALSVLQKQPPPPAALGTPKGHIE
jgi:hypothetical protein